MKAVAIFGIARDSSGSAFLGVITETNVSAHLPDMHLIHTVTQAHYLSLTSSTACPFSAFQLIGNHYFCQTYDLTQLFPSVSGHNPEFVWNRKWIDPFRRIGLAHCCCSLIQGIAITSSFIGHTLTVTYLVRRSAANSGTRYNSRGLDAKNNAGNEVECELIIVDQNRFWSHGWRRGSPPIRWRTELKTKLSKPTHRVDNDCTRGTLEYFEKLRSTLNIRQIRVISLLETSPGKSEVGLHNALKQAVEDIGIPFIAFDANRILEERGSIGCQQEFEQMIEPLIDLATGTVDPVLLESPQGSLNRYNCADSLDRTNLVTFYLSIVCMKRWGAGQLMIDFLAKAFLASGNIVSILSTNTDAIKVEAIRAFAPSIPPAQSDAAVTLERRLQNVAFDPIRNEALLFFAYPPAFPPVIWFDPPHLTVFGDFPVKLFDAVPITIEIGGALEVVVLLPRPVFLRAISIRTCTAESFMVHGDAEEILGIRTIPQTSATCIFTFDGCFATRFLTLRFFVSTSTFCCGNIAIAGEIPGDSIVKQTIEWTSESNAEFGGAVQQFVGSARTLRDLLLLERSRLSFKISDDVLFDLSSRYLINPYVWNTRARLLSASRTGCAFCGIAGPIMDRFSQNSHFSSLIVRNQEGDLLCCAQCLDVASAVSHLAETFQSEYLTTVAAPAFETVLSLPEQRESLSVISRLQTASFSDQTKNCLLGENCESIHIPGSTLLRLHFHGYAIISSIVIYAAGELDVEFGQEHTVLSGEGQATFNFEKELIGLTVQFHFRNPAEVTKIECIGRLVEHYHPRYESLEFHVNLAFQEQESEWFAPSRTALYRFQSVKTVRGVSFSIINQDVQRVVLCCTLKGDLTAWEVLTLPRVETRSILFYPIGPYTSDQVQVHYTDCLPRIQPHKIMFHIE
jgi:hypothetical protein